MCESADREPPLAHMHLTEEEWASLVRTSHLKSTHILK